MKKKSKVILGVVLVCCVMLAALGWTIRMCAPVTVYCVERIQSVDGKEKGYEVVCLYDEHGNLLRITEKEAGKDPVVQTMTYDEDGNLTGYSDNTGVKKECSYDQFRQILVVTEKISTDGIIKTTYDKNGNILSDIRDYGETSSGVYWTYDGRGNVLSMKLYENEKLRREEKYTYDIRGNLSTAVKKLDGEVTYSTKCTYDLFGRIIDASSLSGEGIMLIGGGIPDPRPIEYEFHYNDEGQLIAETRSDGDGYESAHTWSYDEEGRLSTFNHGSLHKEWTYDENGNVATHKDLSGSVTNTLNEYSYVSFVVPRWQAEKMERMQKAFFLMPDDFLWPVADDAWMDKI